MKSNESMNLCLDIGNTQVYCGVFTHDYKVITQFRYNTNHIGSSDQFGIFLLQFLRENALKSEQIGKVAIASVVPSVDHSVASAFVKYFKLTPMFLTAGIKTGIKIAYNNPGEIGADLIAGAVGGLVKYPDKHLIIFDFGTASTVIYITPNAEFVGGAVLPGMRLMMESLQNNTAKLFTVNISAPKQIIAKDTRTAIQSGLYYTQIGAVKEFVMQIVNEYNLKRSEVMVIGTGGFATMLNAANIFDEIVSDLSLIGLMKILELNS